MNGESKRSFAVALASFAIGAVVAGVLGNSATRQQIARAGKKLAKRARTVDLA
jgi:hypothetical protein